MTIPIPMLLKGECTSRRPGLLSGLRKGMQTSWPRPACATWGRQQGQHPSSTGEFQHTLCACPCARQHMLSAQGASTCTCVCVHAHAWIQNVGSVEEEHLCLFENTLQARGGGGGNVWHRFGEMDAGTKPPGAIGSVSECEERHTGVGGSSWCVTNGMCTTKVYRGAAHTK